MADREPVCAECGVYLDDLPLSFSCETHRKHHEVELGATDAWGSAAGGINTDGLAVANEQEGLYLTFYHLRMAAQYFEATPTEIEHKGIASEFSYPAMRAWLTAMETLYPED